MSELSVNGWRPTEDAVMMQSERLVPSVPPYTEFRPGIGALLYRTCTWHTLAHQANEDRHVVGVSDYNRTYSFATDHLCQS